MKSNKGPATGILLAGLAFQATAYGYGGTANVTFSWGTGGTEKGWTSLGGTNTLGVMTDGTYFSQQSGNGFTSNYNPDFASAAQCASIVAGLGGNSPATRKYGCRYLDASTSGNPVFVGTPVTNAGPGPSASGTLTVTDTTLTGTLTISATTDQPTGGTTNSVGNGASGYNLRQADNSPFGNGWNGVSTSATLAVNLTGTFTSGSWLITGGTARLSDSSFLCQTGGFSSPANILCTSKLQAGAISADGSQLSWGWDIDGGASGTAMDEIQVYDVSDNFVESLSGVLANLSIDGAGNITTNSGEVRSAASKENGCGSNFVSLASKRQRIQWDGTQISCGTLISSGLVITGIAPVPVPAAVWLFGGALGALGWMRRKTEANPA